MSSYAMEIIMNGSKKFHPARSPAFAQGQAWFDSTNRRVEIVGVEMFAQGKFDGEVFFKCDLGTVYAKDAWNFQVRYNHQADLDL